MARGNDAPAEFDFANSPPSFYPATKKGRAIPGQTFEVDGVCIRRPKETFEFIGLVDRGNNTAVAVYVSRWKGSTRIELHEMERVYSEFSRSGRVIFTHFSRVDELIGLLEQARDFARSLPAPKVKVRNQTKPKGTEK